MAPTKRNGYVQLSWEGVNKLTTLGEVLAWVNGCSVFPGVLQASHLCDQPRCTILEHVVVETTTANNSRKNCGILVDCAHCDMKYLACPHNPRCIPKVASNDLETWDEWAAKNLHNYVGRERETTFPRMRDW